METPRSTRVLPDREANQPLIGQLSQPQWVPVRSLRPADSPRAGGEDVEHARMLAGVDARLPPIVVHRPTMRVIDGMHRLAAATLRGDELIEARFFDGTEHEAFVLAVQTNIAHGLPLSRADRTRAAERVIAARPGWSDRAVAAAVGLSAQTVRNIRRRMRIQSDSEAHARTGRDGRVRPLDGAEGRLRVARILRARPEASLREVAREAGVSPSTVRDVRRRLQRGEDPLPRPRQRLAAPTPVTAGAPDPAAVLKVLQQDPAIGRSESGRQLVRWLFSRAIRADERLDVIDKVPPHCTYIIANVARSCAGEWSRLAEQLERRDPQSN